MDVTNIEESAQQVRMDESGVAGNPGGHSPRGPHPRFWLVTGGAFLAVAGAWAIAGIPDGFDILLQSGLRPAHAALAGILCAAMGYITKLHVTQAASIMDLHQSCQRIQDAIHAFHCELDQLRDSIPTTEQFGEAAARHVAPMIADPSESLHQIASSVEQTRASAEAARQKLEEAERARLTLAGSLDSLGARIEKLQKDMKEPRRGSDVSIEPISRALEAAGREQDERATLQLEAVQNIHDTLKDLETRLMQQIQEVTRMMQQPAPESPRAAATSPASLMSVPDASDASVEFKITEGPREARTVLASIEKLRNMRGT